VTDMLFVVVHRPKLSPFMAMQGSQMTLNLPLKSMERNTQPPIS